MKGFLSIAVGALLVFPANLFAGSGASFLNISVGARAVALGGTYNSLADDASSLFWNPSGLAANPKREFMASHAELFAKTRLSALSYSHPTRIGSLGFGALYLSQGEIEGRSESRAASGSFGASDLALSLAYARPLTKSLRTGVVAKVIRQSLASEKALGFAFDLGLQASHFPGAFKGVGLGVSLQNLGPSMRFVSEPFSLPLTMSLGASYKIGPLALASSFSHRPYDGRLSFSFGTEYWAIEMGRGSFNSAFALRIGYLAAIRRALSGQGDAAGRLGVSGLGAGFGFGISRLFLDYAITPNTDLGNAQRISLSARF